MKALVLGGVAWNTMVYVDEFPQPVPQTVFAQGAHQAVGSSGAGKAMNLRHLGADVALWGLVGDDEAGRRIVQEIESRGIEFFTQLDPAGTMQHINLMDRTGERISIFVYPGSQTFAVDLTLTAPHLEHADLVAVTILDYCRQYLPALRRRRIPTWIDIHDYDGVNPYHREFIDAADYLFMSSLSYAAWRTFLEERVQAGLRVGVCTHSSLGASGLSAEHGWVDVPALPVDVVDTNGAGDAFFAGFALRWVQDQNLEAAMAAGTQAAAQAVQSPDLAPLLER